MLPNPDKAEFRRLRDQRTITEAGSSGTHSRIMVLVSDGAAGTYATQITTLVLTNILARFCPTIHVVTRSTSTLPRIRRVAPEKLFDRALLGTMKRLDPYGNFSVSDVAPKNEENWHTISVNPTQEVRCDFAVTASGWRAVAGKNPVLASALPMDESPNPVGPSTGACLAAADAFRVATGYQIASRHNQITIDLWNEEGRPRAVGPELDSPVPLGRALLAGAGGVGGSWAFLGALMDLDGTIAVVDHDNAEWSNLNRTLSLEYMHARAQVPKAMVARELLHESGLAAFAYSMRLDEFYGIQRRMPRDTNLILAVANDHGAYRHIQAGYPPLVMHASTSPSWRVVTGYHRPLVDACVAGLYEDSTAPMKCSEGEVPSAGPRLVGSLPFLAPLAASVLLGQTLRNALGAEPPRHVLRTIDIMSVEPQFNGFNPLHREDCFCRTLDAATYEQYIAA